MATPAQRLDASLTLIEALEPVMMELKEAAITDAAWEKVYRAAVTHARMYNRDMKQVIG
jgi:hypothetical protein